MKGSVLIGLAASTVLVMMSSSPAEAGTIVGGSISSSQGSFTSPCCILDNMVNQSGLSSNYVSGVTDFDGFVASATHNSVGSGFNAGFANGGGLPLQFTFDLGQVLSIDRIAFWATDYFASVRSFELFSDTDEDFSNGLSSLLGTFNPLANGSSITPAQIFSFTPTSSQYFHVNVLAPNASFPGIGEVAFRSVGAEEVPTPALLPGLIGMGVAAFSKKRKGEAAAEEA